MKRILLAAALALLTVPAWAQVPQTVRLCSGTQPNCPLIGAANPLPITGSISASISGFTPSASGARGTPLSVTTSDSSGTLPTGAVVIVSNVGSNPMYCNVNAVAATASDQLITASGGWFAFTIPAAVTTLRCIATGGSTTANTLGGSGIATGTGGGSGGGGGGAITIASGAVASGAYSSGAFASGSIASGAMVDLGAVADAAATAGGTGTLSAKLRLMTTQLGTLNTSLGTINTTLGTPLQTGGAVAATLSAETTKVIGTIRIASGGVASGSFASGSIASGAVASGAFASGSIASGALASGSMVDLLTFQGTKAAGTAAANSLLTGGVYNSSPLTLTTGQQSALQFDASGYLKTNVTNANANGRATPANSSPVVLPATPYETVAASVTGQALGATGGTGDYLSHCVIYPVTTSPGVVTVFDSTSSATNNVITFAGGSSSLSNLAPISIPVGAVSVNGAWKVTTGTNVLAICYGNFT